jgi:hypothetical protein
MLVEQKSIWYELPFDELSFRLSGLGILMPQQNLDPTQIGSLFQQMGREAVP